MPRGKSLRDAEKFLEGLRDEMTMPELAAIISETRRYPEQRPDESLEQGLTAIDRDGGPILLFVGRLISTKGIQSVIVALPAILSRHPEARLLVVGHGPLREPMEAFVHALGSGKPTLARNIVHWGRRFEGSEEQHFLGAQRYFERLDGRGKLEKMAVF